MDIAKSQTDTPCTAKINKNFWSQDSGIMSTRHADYCQSFGLYRISMATAPAQMMTASPAQPHRVSWNERNNPINNTPTASLPIR